jgi:hypothetical protein
MGNICWIASYPKSGNTWVRAFIANYLENGARPVDLNALHELSQAEARAFRFARHAPGGDSQALELEEICALRTMVQAEMAAEAHGTTFVKTHNFHGAYRGYPLHHAAVTSGAIYIVRNPLDVAISLANYFSFSLDQAIDFMAEELTGTLNEAENVAQVISSWSLNVASWTAQANPSVLVLRYEDLLDKPLKMFRKVVSLMGLPADPGRLKKAVEFTSFRQLQAQERSTGFVERHEDAKQSLRSGRKGQCRAHRGKAQVQRIVADPGEQMARFRYLPPGMKA